MIAIAAKRRRRRPPPSDGVAVRELVGARGASFLRALGAAWAVEPKRGARGRADARRGRVHMLTFDGTAFRARVTGKREHRVMLGLAALDDASFARAETAIARSPAALAAVRGLQFSPAVEAAFSVAGVSLLPRAAGEVTSSCTCTDDVRPCRHLLALALVVAHTLDRDPSSLLRLRGRTPAALADAVAASARPSTTVHVDTPPRATTPAAAGHAASVPSWRAPHLTLVDTSSTPPSRASTPPASTTVAAITDALAPRASGVSTSSMTAPTTAPPASTTMSADKDALAPRASGVSMSKAMEPLSTGAFAPPVPHASTTTEPPPARVRVRVSRPPSTSVAQTTSSSTASSSTTSSSTASSSTASSSTTSSSGVQHAGTKRTSAQTAATKTVPVPVHGRPTMLATRIAFEDFDRALAAIPASVAVPPTAPVLAARLASSTWPEHELFAALLEPLYERAAQHARMLLEASTK